MSVREFDGVDDLIVLNKGAVTDFNGAHSGIMLVKPTTVTSTFESYMAAMATTEVVATLCTFVTGATYLDLGGDNNGDASANMGVTAGFWQWIGWAKASGTVTVKLHRSAYGTGVWTHTVSSGTFLNDVSALTSFVIGASTTTGTAPRDQRVASVAVWRRQLADAEFETFVNATSQIYNASGGAPLALWDFNQTSISSPVLDLTNGGADQTSIVGTTVVADDPSGYTYGRDPVVSPDGIYRYSRMRSARF